MKSNHKVLILHDLCTTGKAALTNMLPVLSVMQIEVCPLPTMLLSAPTGGKQPPAIHTISLAYIQDCANQYIEENIEFSAIFIGYLGNEEMVMAAQYLMQKFQEVPIFFDPIMGDAGNYYSNFGEDYKKKLVTLMPYTNILLPNITELYLLSGHDYQNEQTKEELTAICQQLKIETIVITGVCMQENTRGVALWNASSLTFIELNYEEEHYHGTGDLFASVLLGNYVNGHAISKCINRAHAFVLQCIRTSKAMHISKREGLRIEHSLRTLLND